MGFVFQSAIAATLGLSGASDNFQLAWSIVTFGTIIFFTLVPILLVPRMENPETREVSIGDWPKFAILGALLTIAQLVAAELSSPQLGDILRWSALSHLFASTTAVPLAVAYIRKRFVVAGIGPAINGAALLVSFVTIGAGGNPSAIGACLAFGYLAQMLFVGFFGLYRSAPLRQSGQVPIRLFIFLVAFTLLSKFQPLLERFLSVGGPTGSTATLGFGQKLAQGLLLFAAFGLALTANATLARKVKSGDFDGAADLMAKTLVTTFVFSCVILLAAIPSRDLAIQILFVRGEFSTSDAHDVSDVLLAQFPWVIACALTGALTSYLYIERNYLRVATAAVIGLVVTYGVSHVLQGDFPVLAVPLASSAGSVVTLLWVSWLVIRSTIWPLLKAKLGDYRETLYFSGIVTTASFIAAVVFRSVSGPGSWFVNLGLTLILILFLLCLRLLRPLWAQCRAAVGGKL
ncbi:MULTISPECIES: lipid II flippase MurJ [Arthrobacter]|uniref:Uncharacterized protein n=1 Tax=Arthrobacter terricola TaxID=2547396 RepID=A0A4R5KK86_9MICC|nr:MULTISPECIES: lipid II flippase MurJ [Arthrobacter]MBT8159262.1 hypothetical protein [Arthrobacter sp. GN70]TDF94907.1 hypothetical protein E1809_12845 [Arthrobacter terricola]